MTRPSLSLQKIIGPLIVLLGVVAIAYAGPSAEAGDTESRLVHGVGDPIPSAPRNEPEPPPNFPEPTVEPPPTEPPSEPPIASLPTGAPGPQQQAPNLDTTPVPDFTVEVVERSCYQPDDRDHYYTARYLITDLRESGVPRTWRARVNGVERSGVTITRPGQTDGGLIPAPDGTHLLEVYPRPQGPTVATPFTVELCDNEPTAPTPTTSLDDTTIAGEPDEELASDAAAGSLGATIIGSSVGNVFLFADPDTPVGESTLVRTDDGLLATFWIGSLPPAEAITLWWVVFNQPANCTPPACGEDDLFIDGDPTQGLNDDQIAAAGIVVGYAAGTLVSDDGSAFMVARLDAGHPGADAIIGDDTDGLLDDAAGAEVHLVARSHGPAIAGLGAIQTTSYAGGCDTFLDPPAAPATAGECADVAFAVHQP